MSQEIYGGDFRPSTKEGDPEKRDYLHSHGRSLKRNIMVQGFRTDDRQCPGCMFPDAPEGKWPHTYDMRCERRQGVLYTDGRGNFSPYKTLTCQIEVRR